MHLNELVKDCYGLLKNNYILAAPTLVASFLAAVVSMVVMGRTPDESMTAAGGLLIIAVTLYAHGVTLVMAREVLRTGTTSLETAQKAARRHLVPLLTLTIAMTVIFLLGLRMFVLPLFGAIYFLLYALPSLMLDRHSPLDAIRRSVMLVLAHPAATFVLFTGIVMSALVLAIVNAMLGIIPLLGQIAMVLLTSAYGALVAMVLTRTYEELTINQSQA